MVARSGILLISDSQGSQNVMLNGQGKEEREGLLF
jgi:hypothetical protein